MVKKEKNISISDSNGVIIGNNNKQTINETKFTKDPKNKSGEHPHTMLIIAILTLIVTSIGVYIAVIK